MKKFFVSAAVIAMFAACSQQEDPLLSNIETPIAIESAGVMDVVSSRSSQPLTDGSLGLYVSGSGLTDKYLSDNVEWKYVDNQWKNQGGTLLFAGEGKQTAYAYHPYVADAYANGFTNNGTTDLLWWKSDGALSSASFSVDFTHALSKLVINLKKGTEVNEEIKSVKVSGTYATGTPNFADQTWSFASDAQTDDVTAVATTASSGMDATYTTLLIPQSTSALKVVITTTNNRIFTYRHSGELTFDSGTAYTLELKLGGDVMNIGSNEWVKVVDWNAADEVIPSARVEESYVISGDTYIVYDADGLYAWRKAMETSYYNLTLGADITLAGENNWIPLDYFDGIIDGAGHTITGLNIVSDEGYLGFLSWLQSRGEVKNLTVQDFTVKGDHTAGAIAGDNSGKITNCHVRGNITATGDLDLGGIVGDNKGIISGCTSDVNITSDQKSTIECGGIAWYNNDNGLVLGCESRADISIFDVILSGIVYYNYGTVIACCKNKAYLDITFARVGLISNNYSVVIGSWTIDSYLYQEAIDGIKWSSQDSSIISCHQGDAATINAKVSEMNQAIADYNITAVDKKKCPYSWKAGTDGYPTLVKTINL